MSDCQSENCNTCDETAADSAPIAQTPIELVRTTGMRVASLKNNIEHFDNMLSEIMTALNKARGELHHAEAEERAALYAYFKAAE